MAWREEADGQGMPGCGLGVYAALLLGLGVVGVVGLVLSSMALLQGDGTSPTELMSGTAVETWRLAPMIKVGVLPPGQVPAAWHDESLVADGSRACALTGDAVLRIEDGKGSRLSFPEITEAASADTPDGATVVRVTGSDTSISCLFGAGDGGLRFLRQVQTEMAKAKVVAPKTEGTAP